MIKIGICLGSFGTSFAAVRDAARQLDALGFDSVWLWDHYVSWNDPREPVLEGLTTLAGIAAVTERIRLGPLVANNTNRHPGRLAKIAATLHEIAGGRFELGLGAGGYAGEQERFGIDQGSATERTARLGEALQIIPALWTGEPTTFDGQFYQLKDAVCAPPLDPPPRLLVGGRGPQTVRLAARYAGGLNVQWRDRARFTEIFTALDAGLAERGCDRDGFDLSLHPNWNDLGDDPLAKINEWASMGFTRVMLYVAPPFDLGAFEQLARLLDL